MLKAFFKSKEWALWAYGGGIILALSMWTQVQLTVQINGWYGNFYKVLQTPGESHIVDERATTFMHTVGDVIQHDLPTFWEQLWIFYYIAIPYVLIAAMTLWFTRQYSFAWREALTKNYLPRWLNMTGNIEGASQRMQEDTYKFAKIVESLGVAVVRAVMTLVAFLPILSAFSDEVTLPGLKGVEHSLVYVALFVSIGGLVISWFVGYYLPGLEYNNQVKEAAFRKKLVHLEDTRRYESDHETLLSLFTGVKVNYKRLFNHYGYFDIWMNLYDQSMILVPYIIMGPAVMSSSIMISVVVQISQAFKQVHGSFALVLHRWTDITELRSIWKRLHEFEEHLD